MLPCDGGSLCRIATRCLFIVKTGKIVLILNNIMCISMFVSSCLSLYSSCDFAHCNIDRSHTYLILTQHNIFFVVLEIWNISLSSFWTLFLLSATGLATVPALLPCKFQVYTLQEGHSYLPWILLVIFLCKYYFYFLTIHKSCW